jgi:hypothetical protein
MIFKPTSTISTEQKNPDESFVYSLASSKARSLMKIVDVESFAVDDCIILTNSKNFEGWDRNEVTTTILYTHLPIPEDLEKLREEKLPDFEKKYYDSPHYRLVSFRPSFRTWSRLDVTLAPIGFLEYYSLTPFFDAPLLAAPDGSKVSIRQKYGSTALTYSSITQGTSLIPTPVSIQCIAITKDQQILLMRRSSTVAFYPDHWSASFEETMNASGLDPNGKIIPADADFFEGAIRGLDEEFAIPSSAVESIKLLSLNVEYPTLSVDAITVIKIDLTASEIKNSWLLYAMDKDEASKFDLLSTELTAVIDKLFSKILWHPSARMRLIQFLFHTYGIEEVVKTIQSKMNSDKTD